MRVIAGSRRSLPLKSVPGTDTRPTTDRIKETLFNILQSEIPGCRFLDVFAGSGGIGIEALSRGAAFAVFIENDSNAVRVIRDNISFTKFGDAAHVLKGDAIRILSSQNRKDPFDIVFCDPPYALGIERELLQCLANDTRWIRDDSLIIVEAALDTDFSWAEDLGWEIRREKKYKTNKHVFLKKADILGETK